MINLNVVKQATNLVVTACSSTAVGTIIGAFCPANSNAITKAAFIVAGGAIGGLVGCEAGKYMSDLVEDTYETVKLFK